MALALSGCQNPSPIQAQTLAPSASRCDRPAIEEVHEMEKAEADAKGCKHLAGAQIVSAPVLFYELLVINIDPSTSRSAATVASRPRTNARTCRSSHNIQHFFAAP
jgi:hypothetical protein